MTSRLEKRLLAAFADGLSTAQRQRGWSRMFNTDYEAWAFDAGYRRGQAERMAHEKPAEAAESDAQASAVSAQPTVPSQTFPGVVSVIRADMIDVSSPGHPLSITGEANVELACGHRGFMRFQWLGELPTIGARYQITVDPR